MINKDNYKLKQTLNDRRGPMKNKQNVCDLILPR